MKIGLNLHRQGRLHIGCRTIGKTQGIAKDFFVIEREYLDQHPDSGYFT